jgi:hypothetical protein
MLADLAAIVQSGFGVCPFGPDGSAVTALDDSHPADGKPIEVCFRGFGEPYNDVTSGDG